MSLLVTDSATQRVELPAARGPRLAALAVTGALLLCGTTGIVAATAEALLRLH